MAVTFLTNEDREELEQMITEMGENIQDSEQNQNNIELLSFVYANGNPDNVSFAYTVKETPNWNAIHVFGPSENRGGVLTIALDPAGHGAMDAKFYLYNASGEPYKLAGSRTNNGGQYANDHLQEGSALEWYAVGEDAGAFCVLDGSITINIPADSSVMVATRFKTSNGTITTAAEYAEFVKAGGLRISLGQEAPTYVNRDMGVGNANRYLVTDEQGRVTLGDNIETMPGYLMEEIEVVGGALRNLQLENPKSLTFAFLADLHFYNTYSGVSDRGAVLLNHNMYAIDAIRDKCRVEFAVFAGDVFAEAREGTKDKAEHLKAFEQFAELVGKRKVRSFIVKGNHDDNSLCDYDSELGYELGAHITRDIEMYARCFRHNENVPNVHMDDNRERLYYFVDFPTHQIRVIFLNSVDIPETLGEDGYRMFHGIHDYGYSNEQLNWVSNVALDFSDKPDAEKWAVVTVQHIADKPIPDFSTNTVNNGEVMYNIFEAFKNRNTYTFTSDDEHFPCGVSCDFTDAKQNLICRLSGHTHKDWYVEHEGTLYISTMHCAHNAAGNKVGQDGITYEKVPGTADESAFDFITIDKDTKTVHATRFGVGVDRIMQWT